MGVVIKTEHSVAKAESNEDKGVLELIVCDLRHRRTYCNVS